MQARKTGKRATLMCLELHRKSDILWGLLKTPLYHCFSEIFQILSNGPSLKKCCINRNLTFKRSFPLVSLFESLKQNSLEDTKVCQAMVAATKLQDDHDQ